MKNIFRNYSMVLAILWCHGLQAQEFNHPSLWSFEKLKLEQWQLEEGQSLSTTKEHYKHGKQSLEWKWEKPGSIHLKSPIGFEPFNPEGADKAIPSYAVWIYNRTPVDDYLTFNFCTNEQVNCHFNFKLNFRGWRAAWVSFERDMQGEPQTGMNRLRIDAPKSVSQGELFVDHMILCINIDSRHQTPDKQVPFVNKGTKSHWLIQESASHLKPDLALPLQITETDRVAVRQIENRFLDDILKAQTVSASTLEKLKSKASHYQIIRRKGHISGRPVWFARNAELYIPLADRSIAKLYRQNKQDARSLFDLMLQVARAHANCEAQTLKGELHDLFMDLYDHMVDQGIAAGSGLGTIHHYGYNWRNYYRALFIMRDVLKEEGCLQEAIDGLQWYAAIGETFIKPSIKGMDMDAFNTQVMGRLASVLIMEDSPEKMQYLACFARWIDNGLQPAPGLNDAFKIDGSAYHHANHYPAYATGGMNGAVRMVYFLSGTPFQVSSTGHETLKKALLTMRFYCNLTQWPVSMSGRHPEGDGALKPEHFAILAKAGSPDGSVEIDPELGAAYLRLSNTKRSKYWKELSAQGVKAEKAPQGHIVMPYASSSVHRRDDWMASVRGHSRYLWASEHYLGANLYGRYLAHGQLQVMGQGNPVNNKASGFVQAGWDWNRFPGTTAINLPLDDLRANILNVDQYSGYEEMLFSDEAFAGGVHADNNNGVFAFILHEHDKYQGSLRARKSYFFFDGQIICLGSGIENDNTSRPTETTLFQNHLGKGDGLVLIDGKGLDRTIQETAWGARNLWLLDNKNNGYYIPEGDIYLRQGVQHSRDESSEKPTEGTFVTAVLKHGTAPKDANYQYCVFPAVNVDEWLKKNKTPAYEVLEQSVQKHIVKYKDELAYVFFEPAEDNTKGPIRTTNIPCLAMTQQQGERLKLHVCNPDLALYDGPADEVYENGKRVERSIYSRPWRSSESKSTRLVIEVVGKWKSEKPSLGISYTPEGNTLLDFTCKDGLTQKVVLQMIED